MNTTLIHQHKSLEACADLSTNTIEPFLKRALATLKVWHRRHTTRAQLRAELEVMDLVRIEKDTGLPTGTLRQEAYKPFWKA